MTPRLQNADCRVQAPRGSVGGGWGVPTWPLTLETLWCQKSDADRGGNPDRRQSQDGNITSTTDTGATVFRPAAGRKPVFSQQGGPRPRQPHKLVEGGFDSRPCSHSFGASDSPAFNSSPETGTVCAALTSSTPSVSCGGFIPGLSARVVVWFRIGVEVSLQRCWCRANDLWCGKYNPHSRPNREFDSPDRCQFARRFTPVSGHYFGRECVYAGRRAILSVVVPAGPFGGVRDVTTDAPGVGGLADAGRFVWPAVGRKRAHGSMAWSEQTGYRMAVPAGRFSDGYSGADESRLSDNDRVGVPALFRGPAGSAGSGASKSRNTETASVSEGENPSTPANFHGSRPWLKRTWPKSRTNERSRKCRECRQPQPSQCNLESRSPKSLTIGNRNIRGMFSKTAIRSSFLASHGNFLEQLPQLLASVMASSPEARIVSKKALPVVGCGGWRVGESTGLPRRKVWGALSGHVEHTGQCSLGLCWRDRQGRSVTRLPAILKNKTEVGQVWTGAPTVGPGNRGADAIESLSANQGSRSERNASDVSDAYLVRTGRNADEKHDLFLCRGVV